MNAVYIALRFVSLILIVAGIMLLGADFIDSLEKGGHVVVRSVDQAWSLLSATGPAGFKSWAETSLPSPVSGWLVAILGLWAFAAVGVPGIVLAFIFGRRTADAE
ncbi:MAG: hypothetical protein GC166_04280 [Alphaproteobacteria bacterium]|nr:hypothetical protein [Alphaproteobacteria bacterium]